ncbi:MAG: aminotransferase class V-fold PLP-dependent enzyme [Vicinamibacterales bacterium]
MTPLTLTPAAFRAIGHRLVDDLARQLAAIPAGPVTHDERPSEVRAALDTEAPLPEHGRDAATLVTDATERLFAHALFNAHPRFWGYITSSPAPIGVLGDLLASALNQNVGAWTLSPGATEIEAQVIRWIGTFLGYPAGAGGLLVSGGNMANLVGLLAARAAKAPWDVRVEGAMPAGRGRLRVYASTETHTWLQKAADIIGLGTGAIRWIAIDAMQRIDVAALERAIVADRAAGDVPMAVVGTAGTVSTGAIDPLPALARLCRAHDVWFHVDGAYGAFAATVPGAPADLAALAAADSVAVDPHKWLYAPLEAGCALVRSPEALRAAFAYHPAYYHFDEAATNYFDHGPQNSRGFRALKVWLAFQQAGASGYRALIGEDLRRARLLADVVDADADLALLTQHLSITTFRYVPADLASRQDEADVAAWLDQVNRTLLDRLQRGGELFVSNAVVDGRYALRACLVNFQTTDDDVRTVPAIVVREARAIDAATRPAALGASAAQK